MAVPISDRTSSESKYLKEIVQLVHGNRFFEVTRKINNTFFDGCPLAPKSFASMASMNVPVRPPRDLGNNVVYVEMKEKISLGGILGFIEGVPLIGSAIAAVHAIGELYCTIIFYLKLDDVVRHFDYSVEREEKLDKIFDTAVAATMHQNRLIGSLLGLIPLVKPAVRASQGILFHLYRT
ncbi:MAG TPA: hypothetical protein VLG49_05075 [Rhabdochlamydiaceae bacterium]|nr:hypothetical protein [Rhabdochlamydiaceae bacterium]